jgi:hypothetical protein
MCPYLQVNRYAFSGGQDSIEEQRLHGANLEVLSFFFIPFANIYEGDSLVRSCKVANHMLHIIIYRFQKISPQ